MAKMKWGNNINWRELHDTEYSEDDYADYEGPTPPSNILLNGFIKKAWATETQNGDPMIKVLFEAAENSGEKKQYNGCPIWDNVLFTMPQVKFKWQPWLDTLGITLADLKNKTVVDEDDNVGAAIVRIGAVKFTGDLPARVKTKREKYEDDWQVRVGRWLPPADIDDVDDEMDDDGEDDPF